MAGLVSLIGVTPDATPGECRPVGAWDGYGGIVSWGLRPRLLAFAALRLRGRSRTIADGT